MGRSSEAGAHAPEFEKLQILGNSYPGLGRQFENFPAWPHGLNVASRRGFVKFHSSDEIRFCNDGDVGAVENRRILEGLIFTSRRSDASTRFVHDPQRAVGESPLSFSSCASPRLLAQLHRMRSHRVVFRVCFPVQAVQDRIPEVDRAQLQTPLGFTSLNAAVAGWIAVSPAAPLLLLP